MLQTIVYLMLLFFSSTTQVYINKNKRATRTKKSSVDKLSVRILFYTIFYIYLMKGGQSSDKGKVT